MLPDTEDGNPAMSSIVEPITEWILWVLIDAEARAWRTNGHAPRLWWRDDDARQPSDSLERLLALAERHNAPVALAVIPDADVAGLAEFLLSHASASVIQHGCDHVDRNVAGRVSSEFSPDASPADIAANISESWRRLSIIRRAIPVYAPPWNVLLPNARQALRRTPLRALSVYGAATNDDDGLPDINTHVDIMKWRPARFRGGSAILTRLWRHLRARRLRGRYDEPIGLLTHHRNLDAAAWSFLERLLDRLDARTGAFQWRSIEQLLEETTR
jgi:hypothetical protein